MKSYVFAKGMHKCYPFRMKASKSFIGASTHSWMRRDSIFSKGYQTALWICNNVFIEG